MEKLDSSSKLFPFYLKDLDGTHNSIPDMFSRVATSDLGGRYKAQPRPMVSCLAVALALLSSLYFD